MKNKKVLVTCGGGMVAHFLRKLLAEKGADARIHFGIIAQELEAAFTA